MTEIADEKRMRLRYAGTCHCCGTALPARHDAIYERTTKTVRCVECVPALLRSAEAPTAVLPTPEVVDPGMPGASARREFERRRAAREARIRGRHPKLGGLVLALTDEPQSTRSWAVGAVGEERVGQRLNELASDSVRVLHDRCIPGRRSNIDHLAVTTAGVFVIDPKRYRGRPELRVEGGLFRPRVEKLMVGGRDRTKLVDGMLRQVEVVTAVVGADAPVRGVLCFVEADWPVVGGAFVTRGVDVLWPRKLNKLLNERGPLPTSLVAELHELLARSLPAA